MSDNTVQISKPQTLPKPTSQLPSFVSKLGAAIGLVFVFCLFAVLKPSEFLTWGNIQLILLQTAVVGTAALGMTLIIISAGIDLSVGSNIALCTIVIALLLNRHVSPGLAALGGIGAGALCGLVIGTLITRLKLTPFIVTLGLLGAVRGLATGLADNSEVYAPDSWLNTLLSPQPAIITHFEWLNAILKLWAALPVGVWMLLVLAILVSALLRYTRLGRHIFAIGSNEQTARLCGVNVEPTKLLIYTLGAAFAGLAGVLQFSYLTMGDPTTAKGYELDAIAAVVIGGASLSGGQGSIFGSLMGALIMTTIANGCTKLDLANWVQDIVTGVIIVLAVVLDKWRHRSNS